MHTNRIDTCGNPIGEVDAGSHPASVLSELLERKTVLDAIASEPECEGDMPDEIWQTIKTKQDVMAYSQLIVRLTKKNIMDRINAL